MNTIFMISRLESYFSLVPCQLNLNVSFLLSTLLMTVRNVEFEDNGHAEKLRSQYSENEPKTRSSSLKCNSPRLLANLSHFEMGESSLASTDLAMLDTVASPTALPS
jgi:hypothetical protein